MYDIVNENPVIMIHRRMADEGEGGKDYQQSPFWGLKRQLRPYLTMTDKYFHLFFPLN